ncbi:MAG: EH signature domain-containing protein [Betaproteobacteria bacterium]
MTQDLASSLSKVIEELDIASIRFGRAKLVEQAADEAAKAFDGVSKGAGLKETALAAALKFLRNELAADDENAYALLSGVLAEPIREADGRTLLGAGGAFDALLARYRGEIDRGDMWRPTWYGLLISYFSFVPKGSNEQATRGWLSLRSLLCSTWPKFNSEDGIRPPWVVALANHEALLGEDPCAPYAASMLANNMAGLDILGRDLGIPESSWFWHELILAAARRACELGDEDFKRTLGRLVSLLRERPVFRDEAIEQILRRYYECSDRSAVPIFKDYVVSKEVWRNPKLKDTGLASPWSRVPKDVWRMALAWVNEANLRLFFELLSGRNNAEEGRLAFWTGYLEQITWTKLVFGRDTLFRARSDPQLRALVDQEQGLSARLSSNDDGLDAFLMEIGDYVIVEFSRKPNAAYIYPKASLPFDVHKAHMSGGTDELKRGFHRGDDKIIHVPNWQGSAARKLRTLGIHPDAVLRRTRQTLQTRLDPEGRTRIGAPGLGDAPKNANFTMRELHEAARRNRVVVTDFRPSGGRIWVEYGRTDTPFARELREWEFVYAPRRGAWYHPTGS